MNLAQYKKKNVYLISVFMNPLMIQNVGSLNDHGNIEESYCEMKKVLHTFNEEKSNPDWKESKCCS